MSFRRLLWLVLAVAAVAAAAILLQVDDWRRDFSVNHAETTDDAKDPLLRPLWTDGGIDEAASLVREATAGLPRWRAKDEQVDQDHALLRYVRTTLVLRFDDDVDVEIFKTGTRCAITATSRSRVGKGDLGQNPRNLKELMAACRALLARRSAKPR